MTAPNIPPKAVATVTGLSSSGTAQVPVLGVSIAFVFTDGAANTTNSSTSTTVPLGSSLHVITVAVQQAVAAAIASYCHVDPQDVVIV